MSPGAMTKACGSCGTVTRIIVDHLILATVAGLLYWQAELAPPNDRGFYLDDVTISAPYRPSSLPDLPLYLGSLAVGAVFLFTEFLQSNSTLAGVGAAYRVMSVYGFGWMTSGLAGEVIKTTVGRRRPHFLSLCQPNVTKKQADGLVLEYACTSLDTSPDLAWLARKLRESLRSFPSGHSNVAAYMAVFLVFYIHHRWHIRWSILLKPLVQLSLMALALKVGIDRVLENQHFPEDVIVGFLIGTATAIFLLYGSNDTLMLYHNERTLGDLREEVHVETAGRDKAKTKSRHIPLDKIKKSK